MSCVGCTGPLPWIHQILAGRKVVYYHNLTSDSDSSLFSWCISGQYSDESFETKGNELIYRNPSLDDNHFSLYLIHERETHHCSNTSYINKNYQIESKDLEGKVNASLIVTNVVEGNAKFQPIIIKCSEE